MFGRMKTNAFLLFEYIDTNPGASVYIIFSCIPSDKSTKHMNS